MTEADYVYLPLGDLHKHTGICAHITNRWWQVHPEKGLLFFPFNKRHPDLRNSSPQCNSNKTIVDRLCNAFAEVRFVESVLQPIDPKDYVS